MEALLLETTGDIYGWGFTYDYVESKVKQYDPSVHSKLIVPINSFGGDVMEGLAIYSALKGSKAYVEARIVAYAMSMGTVISCSANEVSMPANGWFMIHEPKMGSHGDSVDMSRWAGLLETMADDMAEIYAAKTGKSKDELRQMMKDETWLNGKQALEMGFVDSLTEGVSFEASFDPSKFNNIPDEVKAIASHKKAEDDKKDTENITNKIHEMNSLNAIASYLGFKAKEGSKDGQVEVSPEAFIEALQTKVKEGIDSNITALQTGIDGLKASGEALSGEIEALKTTVSEKDAEIVALKAELESVKTSQDDLSTKVADVIVGSGKSNGDTVIGNPNASAAQIKFENAFDIKGDDLAKVSAAFDSI